jgi:hypothetical protein
MRRPDPSQGRAARLRLWTVLPARRRALHEVLGMATMSTSMLDALAAEAERDPAAAARFRAALKLDPTEGKERPPRLLADEAAARLHISRTTLVRAARDGRVTGAIRVGRSWQFDPKTLALAPPESTKPSRIIPSRPRTSRSGAADAIRGHQPERTR